MLSLLPRRCGEARHLSSLQLKPWLQMFQDHGESEHLQLGSNKSNDRNLCLCFCKIKSAFPLLQSEKAAQTLKHYRNQLHNNFVPGVQNALGKAKPKKKKNLYFSIIPNNNTPIPSNRGQGETYIPISSVSVLEHAVAQSCLTLPCHGLYPARFQCLWDSPGKNTVVGCHFLLQGIFLTQG